MLLILCNASVSQAPELARTLVAEGLCACVNLVPGVRSLYMWEGEVCDDAETTLLIKTTPAAAPRLSARLQALHAYDLPEIVAIPVDLASSDPRYVSWVRAAVGEPEEP